ncbi:MAG: hypothetical protein LBH43_14405 [Treponema sp.]|jgi:hypothetical protein|nr:hypothetical protein [Treponema sp.]
MTQIKILTQLCFSVRGYENQNGVINAGKKALTREASKRYQNAGKKEKAGIPGELAKTAGYNLKHLLHALANWGKTISVHAGGETARAKASPRKRRKGGGRKPEYSGGFVTVLREIWAFFSYRCGKIPSPFMRGQTGFLEQPFHITENGKAPLLPVSPPSRGRAGQSRGSNMAITQIISRP